VISPKLLPSFYKQSIKTKMKSKTSTIKTSRYNDNTLFFTIKYCMSLIGANKLRPGKYNSK